MTSHTKGSIFRGDLGAVVVEVERTQGDALRRASRRGAMSKVSGQCLAAEAKPRG